MIKLRYTLALSYTRKIVAKFIKVVIFIIYWRPDYKILY